ncbi:Spy/CpxP family protein refolding chaperone [Acetobacter lambici]|uniref:Spy/CpxP family protein refolding chaperone n=1 Tax=Acetobacter lambici TaxID=1332824 RepID=A0ABT1F1D9_9PROT|nr:Spy/CpxP family protein refolding chaperone [Acetobacter lambici]MCP1241850.1 Spy/CpxP family protein refolding chaperone [Acetobacter lambici]MCP1257953.1 Spy/CpxP family protein refolding chaperone [Acetobacter lambici]
MMKRALLATTLVMGLAAFSGAAARADEAASTVGAPPPPPSECGGMHHGPGGPGGHILRLDGIKLTADQKKKIKAVFDANRPEDPKAGMEQTHALQEQIRTVLTTPGAVDQAKLQDLEQQISALHTQHALHKLQVEAQIHDILTNKQLKQIAEQPDHPPGHHPECSGKMPPPPEAAQSGKSE